MDLLPWHKVAFVDLTSVCMRLCSFAMCTLHVATARLQLLHDVLRLFDSDERVFGSDGSVTRFLKVNGRHH